MKCNNSKAANSFFGMNLTLRQKMTKGTVVAFLVLVLLLAGAWGLTKAGGNSRPNTGIPNVNRIPVATVQIEPVGQFEVERSYTGRITARRTSDLSFERQGKLVSIHVRDGQHVRQGQPLAELDLRHLETRQKELQARRGEAAAQLDEMIAGPRQELIDAATARVASRQATLQELQRKYERRKRMLASNAVSREDFESTQTGMQAAEAVLQEAQHQLQELRNGTRAEKISAQRSIVAQLDAQLADLAIDLNDSTLRAPFDGVVAARLADEGTVMAPGSPVLRIVEAGVLEAWVGLPVDDAATMVETAEHMITANGRRYVVTGARRLPELDMATRTRTVVFDLPADASTHLVNGQMVRLDIRRTVPTAGFWLPNTALSKGERGLWSVFAVETGRATNDAVVARREVEVVHAEGDRSLVRGTLQEGDHVVVAGGHRIVAGQHVEQIQQASSER